MKERQFNVVASFISLLQEMSNIKPRDFSGAGFVLYKELTTLEKYHCDLVDDDKILPSLKLGTKDFTNYLIEISRYGHPYHDGFHFINHEGIITHVAQFLSPPVDKCLPNIEGQGARTFCSQCSSKIDGVSLIGSVSSNGNIFVFENGNIANEKFLYNIEKLVL